MLIDHRARRVLKILNKENIEAYIVGGAVRDYLLKLKPRDYDICYNATPNDIKRIFKNYPIYEIGIKYGTLTLNYKGLLIEITPFRKEENYIDGRHPNSVNFVNSLPEDLLRRDFTINAMALNFKGEVIDLFGGKNDLKNGVIKAVGNAEVRFSEDALRMLRAYRFASRFGFKIEDNTKMAIFKLCEGLKNLSKERLTQELKQIILEKNIEQIFVELLEVLSPLNVAKNVDNNRALKIILSSKTELKFILFVAFYGLKNAVILSNKEEKIVNNFLNFKDKENIDVYRLFLTKPIEEIYDILWLKNAENLLNEEAKKQANFIIKNKLYKQINCLKIDGNDIKKLGFNGKEIAVIKQEISYKILKGKLKNNRKKLIEYLRKKT